MVEPSQTEPPNPSSDDWKELQMMWQAEANQANAGVSIEPLIVAAKERGNAFRRMIDFRDYREIGISIVMIPVWIWLGWRTSQPWTWYLTIGGIVWTTGYQLSVRRKQRRLAERVPPNATFIESLQEDRRQVQHQIEHLRGVAWWYLLPYGVPLSIYFLHSSWNLADTWLEFATGAGGLILFVVVLYAAIYWINQKAIEIQLQPQRETLDRMIAELRGEICEESLATAKVDLDQATATNDWSQGWNRIIPTWKVAGLNYAVTAIGLALGSLAPDARGFPTWFNEMIGAVIAFELVFFANWWWQSRRANRGEESESVRSGTPKPRFIRPPAIAVLCLLIAIVLPVCYFFFVQFSGTRAGEAPAASIAIASSIDPIKDSDFREVDAYLAGLAEDTYPSLSVSLVRGGEVEYVQSFGMADIASQWLATPQTPYHTASLTKVFTATVAAILHDQGVIDLDAPLADHLPAGVRISRDPRAGRRITLRQLASHTSGLPRGVPGQMQSEKHVYALEPDKLYAQLPNVRLIASPGEVEEYSNLGYGLLGHALERATGRSLDGLIAKHLAEPLGMTNTFIIEKDSAPERIATIATGYQTFLRFRRQHTHSVQNRLAGSGGLASSAEDLATFLLANMRDGWLPNSVRHLTQTATPIRDGEITRTGLGWSLRTHPPIGSVIKKNGGRSNTSAWMGFSPKHDVGVVVLANVGSPPVDSIGYELLTAMIPIESRTLVIDGQYAKVTPFSAIRWTEQGKPFMRVGSEWFELTQVDGVAITTIMRFANSRYGEKARMRFSEDFVQVMFEMGHPIKWKVPLGYIRDDGTEGTLNLTMSAEKRSRSRDHRLRTQ